MISVLSHCDVEKEQKMAIRIQRNSKKKNENECCRETMRKRLERGNVKQKIKDKKEERGGRIQNGTTAKFVTFLIDIFIFIC